MTVLAAGELVPAFGVHDAVEQGVADLYHAPDYYFTGKRYDLTDGDFDEETLARARELEGQHAITL